jgi:hypothetical protein
MAASSRAGADIPCRRCPLEVQAILADGGLHAFLQRHPGWEL